MPRGPVPLGFIGLIHFLSVICLSFLTSLSCALPGRAGRVLTLTLEQFLQCLPASVSLAIKWYVREVSCMFLPVVSEWQRCRCLLSHTRCWAVKQIREMHPPCFWNLWVWVMTSSLWECNEMGGGLCLELQLPYTQCLQYKMCSVLNMYYLRLVRWLNS